MNRIERLSAILIQLQSGKVVRGKEIAEKFEISLRTVYRDLETLAEAGVPIIGEAGQGFSLADGYKLPPLMFTSEELMALQTAGKLMDKLTDKDTALLFHGAMTKIKATLRTQEKDELHAFDDSIQISELSISPTSSGHPFLLQIMKAIKRKQVLSIDYEAQQAAEIVKRDIEPIGLFLSHQKWYVLAYCRLRKNYRQFRLDRIRALRCLYVHFDDRHESLGHYLEKNKMEERPAFEVQVTWKKEQLPYLGDQKYYMGYVDEKEEKDATTYTFLTPSICGFARWMLMSGEDAQIEGPPELFAEMERLLARQMKRFQK